MDFHKLLSKTNPLNTDNSYALECQTKTITDWRLVILAAVRDISLIKGISDAFRIDMGDMSSPPSAIGVETMIKIKNL